MPKNKKAAASDSSSDTSVHDDSPPPQKKIKTTAESVGSKSKNDDGEVSWDLPGKKKLKVRSFRGKTYIDIREYYEKDGKLLPGKKGVSLTTDVWQKLKALVPEVDDELKNY